MGTGTRNLSEDKFPSEFYRFSRCSFLEGNKFFIGLLFVKRENSNTFIHGYEAKAAMKDQGHANNHQSREFRGLVLQQKESVAAHISRHNSLTSYFNYLHRVASFENNFWVSYVTRTVRKTITGDRATRFVY